MSTSNVDLKQMFSSNTSGTEIEINNHNLKDKSYQDEISNNMIIILKKFKHKADKNPDDKMTKENLILFLDSLLPVFI